MTALRTLFPSLLSWLLIAAVLPAVLNAAEPAKIKLAPTAEYDWWNAGETVTFTLSGGTRLEAGEELKGSILDGRGRPVETISISAEQAVKDGWQWKPKEPGFYEIEFAVQGADGLSHPVIESFTIRAPNKAKKQFDRNRFSVAVVPKLEVAPQDAIQFGYTQHGFKLDEITLAQKVGFGTALIHSISWGSQYTNLNDAIEPEKGVYKWEKLDAIVDVLAKSRIEIVGQFLSIPVWASPHPESKDKIRICMREANVYAPVNMEDFSNFVTKVVERYGDHIHKWELWNEPNMVGSSVFWMDTPENFVRLLKAGYEAIKKGQPESTVWAAGFGPRRSYHRFYERIMELEANKYFDVLSLHGSWNTPKEFHDIESSLNIAHKPTVNSEWHAILTGQSQTQPVQSDFLLSMRLMKDLLLQIKHGFICHIFFELRNLAEKETIPFAHKNKMVRHSSGLFRRNPRVEPRLPAVVMANFIRATGGKATYEKEIRVGESGIGLLLKTSAGPLFAFWSEEEDLDQASFIKYATDKSKLMDWEAKAISSKQVESLDRNTVYYVTAPNVKAVLAAQSVDALVSPLDQARRDAGNVVASMWEGRLWSEDGKLVANPMPWITTDWKETVLSKEPGEEKFSARAALGRFDEGIQVMIEVVDAIHVQDVESEPRMYFGDSVQVAFDCEGNGLPGGHTELIIGLKDGGEAVTWKLFAADPRGDLPSNWSQADGPAAHVVSNASREDGKTLYKVFIPWSELFPLVLEPGKPIRASIVVNDNDGNGRRAFLEWGEGIAVGEKDPALYGKLQPGNTSKNP